MTVSRTDVEGADRRMTQSTQSRTEKPKRRHILEWEVWGVIGEVLVYAVRPILRLIRAFFD